MTKTLLVFFAAFVVATVPFHTAFAETVETDQPAQEEAQEEKTAKDEADPLLEAQEEAIKKTYSMLTEMMENIGPQEQQHFYMAYNNYNLIETVKIVQKDVSSAIDGCGENNPDMKVALKERFTAWNDAVNPVLEEASGHLDNMVVAQDYAKPDNIRKIFDSLDETRKRTDARIDKIPVTTKEACEFLLGKMDETQDSMVSLLSSTLVSMPQTFQEQENEEKPAPDEEQSDL